MRRIGFAVGLVALWGCSLLDPLDDVSGGGTDPSASPEEAGAPPSNSPAPTTDGGAQDSGAGKDASQPPFDTSSCTRNEREPNGPAAPEAVTFGEIVCGQASDSDTDVLVLTTNGLFQGRLVVTADAPLDVLVQGPGGQVSGTAAPGRPFTLNRNTDTNGETRTVLSTLDDAKPRWTMGWR